MKPFQTKELDVLKNSVFVYKKKSYIPTDPRVVKWIFPRTNKPDKIISKKASGVLGHGLCDKTGCKTDERRKNLSLHWFVIFDLKNPVHVNLLKTWDSLFENFRTDLQILICLSHFDAETQSAFLETGCLPDHFKFTTNINPDTKTNTRGKKNGEQLKNNTR
jgi:hypothetical protein